MSSYAMSAAFSAVSRMICRRQWLGPKYRSIVVIDITGSARWPNEVQLRAREVLREAIRSAANRAGIGWPDLATGDRGDGVMLLISPRVSKVDILDLLVPELAERIRVHNAAVAEELRIRLRVAVHAGEVHRDAHGWVGADLNIAFRLVDGVPLRQRLEQDPNTDLVLVVSELIYESVVRHHYRSIDPAGYTQIRVSVKELDTLAWLHTPGGRPSGSPNPNATTPDGVGEWDPWAVSQVGG